MSLDSRPLDLRPGASVGVRVEDRLGHALGIADEAHVASAGAVAEPERRVAEEPPGERVLDARGVNRAERNRLPCAAHRAPGRDDEDAPGREGEERAVPLPDGARET